MGRGFALRRSRAGLKQFRRTVFPRGRNLMEMYAGCAKTGQICVPIMFRLAGPEIEYIVNDSDCKAFIVEKPFVDLIDSIRDKLPVPPGNYI